MFQYVGRTELPLGIGAFDGDLDIGTEIYFQLESTECEFIYNVRPEMHSMRSVGQKWPVGFFNLGRISHNFAYFLKIFLCVKTCE